MRPLNRTLRLVLLPGLLLASLADTATAAAAAPSAPEPVQIRGTGTLTAQGSGYARLTGSYVLVGSIKGGTLRVGGIDPGTIVRVTGWVSKTRLADGTFVFRGVNGHYYVAGRTIVTTINSRHMRFIATGSGRAVLIGHGSVTINGRGPIRWGAAGRSLPF